VYVATEFCAFVLVLDTESGVLTVSSSTPKVQPHALTASHVGADTFDHDALATAATLHLLVTTALSVNPARQPYVPVT
jgi:hypothetical protein